MAKDTRFKTGNKAAKGRVKGSRNKLTKAYLDALAEDFKDNGKQVIEKVRDKRPDAYLKAVGLLVPKDLDINHSGNINISVIDYAEGDE